MNQHSALRTHGSLLERAAELYGLEVPTRRQDDSAATPQPHVEPAAPPAARVSGRGQVDRERLREGGFIVPDAPVGPLAEEFRIVKRQLLVSAIGEERRRTILVCSAQPDEGKTFCAVNLALSLATERDLEVLLVDGDFAKPEILSILGLEGGGGLIDALADARIDPEGLVVDTDVPGLSVLPAGRHVNDVTELLAADRTRDVLARLAGARPNRIVIFDSPPVLMASPAGVLAAYAGQTMMVVRADVTPEADLKEAVSLVSACDRICLLLNGAAFAATGRKFGSYYGYGQ